MYFSIIIVFFGLIMLLIILQDRKFKSNLPYIISDNDNQLENLKELTERLNAAEKKINIFEKQFEEKYFTLINLIPLGVYILNKDGLFTFVRNFEFLGWESSELLGKHFSIIIHPDYINDVSRDIVLPKYKGRLTGSKNAPGLFDERRTPFSDDQNRITQNLFICMIHKDWCQSSDCSMVKKGLVYSAGYYDSIVRDPNKGFSGTVGVIKLT